MNLKEMVEIWGRATTCIYLFIVYAYSVPFLIEKSVNETWAHVTIFLILSFSYVWVVSKLWKYDP